MIARTLLRLVIVAVIVLPLLMQARPSGARTDDPTPEQSGPALGCAEGPHAGHAHGADACADATTAGGETAVVAAGTPLYLPFIVSPTGPSGGPAPAPRPDGTQPTLVAGYRVWGPQPDYEILRYRPRQFAAGLDLDETAQETVVTNPGPYAGWDVFAPPYREISRILDLERWVDFTLTRPARVAVLWRADIDPPPWLAGWSPGAPATIGGAPARAFLRDAPAGELSLGGVFAPGTPNPSAQPTYVVLFAEANGTPTPAPAAPAGQAAPQPNTTCPAWVHDQYVATGPDGKTYRTWHPAIDPVYWCYFHHEHGSNPGRHTLLFGYSSARLGGEERHEGFKVYRFPFAGGTEIVVTHHFGTASAKKAACVRFHTYDMVIFQGETKVADLHLMADHGKSQHARTDRDLTPVDCPNQAAEADADGSNGVRKFQISTLDPIGYEPWRLDFGKVIVGNLAEFSVNTFSRITDCDSFACTADVQTGDQGEMRYATHGADFGIQAGAHTGTFYTDPIGRRLTSGEAADAMQQFVAPGASVRIPGHPSDHECYSTHPFGGPFVCTQYGPHLDANLEASIRSPN